MGLESRSTPLLWYFLLTIPLAWVFWIPMALDTLGIFPLPIPEIILSSLGGLSPLIALSLIGKFTNQPLLDQILHNIQPRKLTPLVTIGAIGIAPTIFIASNLFAYYLNVTADFIVFTPSILAELGTFTIFIMCIQFAAGMITSPLFEEPGWRGFAFSQLSKKWPRILTSLAIGSYWWLWHQPMNIAFGIYPTVFRYITMVLYSAMIDSLFKHSQQNVLVAMFAHQSYGTAIIFLWQLPDNWLMIPIQLLLLSLLVLTEKRQDQSTHAR